jgi:hypothetical protein
VVTVRYIAMSAMLKVQQAMTLQVVFPALPDGTLPMIAFKREAISRSASNALLLILDRVLVLRSRVMMLRAKSSKLITVNRRESCFYSDVNSDKTGYH